MSSMHMLRDNVVAEVRSREATQTEQIVTSMFLVIALCSCGAHTSQVSESVTVGLMRSDGIVLPVAQVGDSTWLPVHPGDSAALADTWFLYSSTHDGTPVELLTTVQFGINSWDGWGITTTATGESQSIGRRPVPRTGMVIDRPNRAMPFLPLPPSARVWNTVAPAVRRSMSRLERVANRERGSASRPQVVSVSDSIILVEFYHVSLGGAQGDLVYVVTNRPQDGPCSPDALYHAWMRVTSDTVMVLSEAYRAGNCGPEQLVRERPYGVVSVRTGLYVLLEVRLWEGVAQEVRRITTTGLDVVFRREW